MLSSNKSDKAMQDRRKFLRTIIRGGIFTSLTLLGGVLIHRRNKTDVCRQNFACGGCSLSGHCQLNEADRYRLDQARSPEMNNIHGRSGK
jgi:hypothetical protein